MPSMTGWEMLETFITYLAPLGSNLGFQASRGFFGFSWHTPTPANPPSTATTTARGIQNFQRIMSSSPFASM